MTTLWPFVRLATAALGVAAIVRQLVLAVENSLAAGTDLLTVVTNFFSYFTILSNVIAAVALVVSAVWMLRTRGSRSPEPAWLATLLACASTYMIVTGIVYNLLLRNIPIAGISDVWTNETLHVVVPLIMIIDVLFAPRRRGLPWGALLVAIAFPLVWVIYTMTRANFIVNQTTGDPWWYPYPFLDPHLQGGFGGVIAYIVGIALGIIAIAALVIFVGRRRTDYAVRGDRHRPARGDSNERTSPSGL